MIRYSKTWRCKNKKCPQVSIFQNSFFAESKIEPNQVMLILHMKLINTPSTSIQLFTGHSSSTIATYLKKYRELLAFDIKDMDIKIGGENIEVEIDKTLISRKKSPWTGKDGVWVFGGIERTREKNMFAIMVPDRTRETLYSKIEQFIKPGSIIISDCFSSYKRINKKFKMQHKTVDHSKNFKDPITGAHTNNIESLWSKIKPKIPNIDRC